MVFLTDTPVLIIRRSLRLKQTQSKYISKLGIISNQNKHSTLRKYAYSIILKILPPENENFQMKKKSDIFRISAQNIDCGYSLEPPQRVPTIYVFEQK